MKPTGRACDSCRRPGATDHVVYGIAIVACAECVQSEFRVARMVERARLAGVGK